ncbi:hypothetical protein Daura_30655 [Dactylosporangium aurantiacum]|uniref:Uncharacterized protein n=1 Tax=Dactylosporangium aurantiacum TaxID=35754 RepID=A0A9Q9MIP2_9ACTN|nr:permease prefix domain 1-containing protein [Dactylosporangium aurantiacum]MDG6108758.1 permease prefix domain 1-containing protein [Dactylosporangium aurantiacum]UWZ51117.1 hypothetical protein Daura_30655 [Dactylosporangium aurantiacum]
MGADADVDAVVTAYLDALTRRVPAGRRERAAIRAELRDGLECAVQARVERGVEPADAARQAVGEFGPPEVVAGAFVRELCATWAHRIAIGLLAGGPLVGVAWIAAAPGPAGGWADRVASAVSATSVYPFVLAVAVPAAVLAVAGTGRLMYRLPLLLRIAPPAAVLAAVLCLGGDVSLLIAAGLHGPARGTLTALAVAASVIRSGTVGAAGWRLVRLVRIAA